MRSDIATVANRTSAPPRASQKMTSQTLSPARSRLNASYRNLTLWTLQGWIAMFFIAAGYAVDVTGHTAEPYTLERSGSFTNWEGRTQRFSQAVDGPELVQAHAARCAIGRSRGNTHEPIRRLGQTRRFGIDFSVPWNEAPNDRLYRCAVPEYLSPFFGEVFDGNPEWAIFMVRAGIDDVGAARARVGGSELER